MKHSSEILLYQTANGETKIDVRLGYRIKSHVATHF
jgi:hypothetical protein